jgi:hypothetical protein
LFSRLVFWAETAQKAAETLFIPFRRRLLGKDGVFLKKEEVFWEKTGSKAVETP